MPPQLDDEAARLRAALGRISRLLDRELANGGLTPSQRAVLGTIARRAPIGLGELAALEGINPTMLSRIVGKLHEAGLVRRTAAPDDRRAAEVRATPAGTRLHARLRDERTRLLADCLARLPAARAADLRAALPALEDLAADIGGRR